MTHATASNSMFCYQCEQTAKGTGCTYLGVCGKEPQTAALQDVLLYAAQDISRHLHRARTLGRPHDRELDVFVVEALFSTVTNVNFDPGRLGRLLQRAAALRTSAVALCDTATKQAGQTQPLPPSRVAWWKHVDDVDALATAAAALRIDQRVADLGADVTALQELTLYGLKGTAAYADHARLLGQEDDAVYAFFHEALSFLHDRPTDVPTLLATALRVGEVNLRVMELLDAGNTGTFGHPEPTNIRVTPVAGKAILVSGHDLADLHQLLEQTQGTGINVYTHGEMLPCNAYPELKKFPHLAGHYGGAWQEQAREFDAFPGAILMTTNCIQKPRDGYAGRLFTTGLVAWPGVAHVEAGADGRKDFSPVIAAALAAPGFAATEQPEQFILGGFARNAVLNVAPAVIEAVKAGKIRRFFLIGGCDGAKPGRNYYTQLAQQVPADCVILTLACGKFRFNKLPFGNIGGIPRLLDVGQCNDSYSAIQIALALAGAFGVGVNDLPLSLILSWYEQKAVCILLTLLHLGIQNIRLGPSLPAFVTPAMLDVLVKNFNIAPITTPEQDLKAILG